MENWQIILLFLAGCALLGALATYFADSFSRIFRRHPPRRPKPPVGGWTEDKLINTSVWQGIFVSLLIGVFVMAALHYLTRWMGMGNSWWLFTAKAVAGLLLGFLYFISTLVTTKEGHHDVVYLLGRRWRRGPYGLGLPEGLNSLLVPHGLATVNPENMQERTTQFEEIKEYSENDVLVSTRGSANWRVLDPYIWQNVMEASTTTINHILQAFRDVMMKFRSHTLRRQQPDGSFVVTAEEDKGIIDIDKTAISDKIRDKANQTFAENRAHPDRLSQITDAVVEVTAIQVRMVELPQGVNDELEKRETEIVQREGERVQAESRRDQINIITKNGESDIDERLAALMVLSDAGKEGPVMVHLSADKGVADAAGQIGGGVAQGGGGLGRGMEALAGAIAAAASGRRGKGRGKGDRP